MMLEIVIGPVELVQVGVAPLGGVMLKVIAPVDCTAPATPVRTAVRTLVPLSVGLLEDVRVISGVWGARVMVAAVMVARA